MVVTKENMNDDKGPKILSVLWILTALTTLIVTARIFIRLRMLRNFGVDDYLIVVSVVMSLAYCGVTTAAVSVGYGRHAAVLSMPKLELAIMLNTVSFLFGILSFTIPKLAVTAMLNRILNPGTLQKSLLWVLTGTAAVVSGICIIMLFTMCDPPEALWKVHLVLAGEAKCKNVWILINYAIFTGSLSAFVDLYLALYPVTVLLKLHMSLRKRIALCAALGLGSIACAMAIIKCTQLHGLADKSDYTYGTADLVIWTNIEADVVIIASCIPTLQPLLELIMGKRTLGSYSNGQSGRYKQSGSNFNTASIDRSKRPAARKDDIEITNFESKESQESILPADQFQQRTFPLAIRRTDNVSVEYEARPDPRVNASQESPRSW